MDELSDQCIERCFGLEIFVVNILADDAIDHLNKCMTKAFCGLACFLYMKASA